MSRLVVLIAGLGLCLGGLVGCDDDPDEPSCEDECSEEGVLQCNGDLDGIEVCEPDEDGCLVWTEDETCGDAQQCDEDATECVCQDGCENSGESWCDGDLIVECVEDSDGCLIEEEQQNCENTEQSCELDEDDMAVCVGGCTDECDVEGESQCDTTTETIQICRMEGDCLVWVDDTDCAETDQFCDDSGDVTECVDTCSDECDLDATQCAEDVVQVCVLGGSGCNEWQDDEDCSTLDPVQTCEDSSGDAVCVLECTSECDTDGAQQCSVDDVIQTCTLDDSNGCFYWIDGTDCTTDADYCDDSGDPVECATCTNGCDTEGTTQCSATTEEVETCTADDNGCLDWAVGINCADTSQVCADGACVDVGLEASCSDPVVVSEAHYAIAGDDFTADFVNTQSLTGSGCYSYTFPDDPRIDAVFEVALAAGETLRVRELGGLDAVLSLQNACGDTETCTFSEDFDETDGHDHTATTAERVYVIVEAYSDDPSSTDYDIRIDIVEDEVCGDGEDNDADGLIDCEDDDCFSDTCPEICDDGEDNDADGDTDCDDADCEAIEECQPYQGVYEIFETGDPIDIEGVSIVFTPDAGDPNGFTLDSTDGLTEYPVTPGSGDTSTILSPGDSTSEEYEFAHLAAFPFYGIDYTSIFVGSNGFVTFGSGRTSSFSTESSFFSQPIASAFADDLDPEDDGTVTVDEFSDHVVVTFDAVPHWWDTETNSFQTILRADGTVEFHYVEINEPTIVVGVGSGQGVEPYPGEVDLFSLPPEVVCDDSEDNDLDGLTDCDDPDCASVDCAEVCDDGFDNDTDGDTDCADSDCGDADECDESLNCGDEVDNDLDGDIDCADSDCAASLACGPGSCENPIIVDTFPYTDSGSDFSEGFYDHLLFEDDTCLDQDGSREGVYMVNLLAGDVLTVSEFGSLDAVFSLQTTCGAAEVCEYSEDLGESDEADGMTFVASTDMTVYVIVEADYSTAADAYSIQIDVQQYTPDVGDLIITEVMQNPDAVDDSVGEWFEVYNPTDMPVVLTGAVISDAGTDSHTIATPGFIIFGGETLVFGNNADTATNGGVNVDYEYADISLDGADEIVITNADGVELDRIEYDGGTEWPNPTGASMQLSRTAIDGALNDDGLYWCESIEEIVAMGDLGTPGMSNGLCASIIHVDEDFEVDPGWTICDGDTPCDWEWGTPTAGPDACAGGTGCYGTNMSGDYSSSTDGANNFVEFGPIDLSAVSNAQLLFDMYLDSEDGWDDAWLEVSADGSVPYDVLTPTTPAYDGTDVWEADILEWTPVTADLSSYVGSSTVYIRWVFDADGSVTYPGFYFDNVAVYTP